MFSLRAGQLQNNW